MQGVEKGRNALIPCKAGGDPEPTVTWLKDMMPIDMTKPRYSIYQGGLCQSILEQLGFTSCLSTASLQILSAQEEDQGNWVMQPKMPTNQITLGQYECVAENRAGSAYSELATLYVRSEYSLNSIEANLTPNLISPDCSSILFDPTWEGLWSQPLEYR